MRRSAGEVRQVHAVGDFQPLGYGIDQGSSLGGDVGGWKSASGWSIGDGRDTGGIVAEQSDFCGSDSGYDECAADGDFNQRFRGDADDFEHCREWRLQRRALGDNALRRDGCSGRELHLRRDLYAQREGHDQRSSDGRGERAVGAGHHQTDRNRAVAGGATGVESERWRTLALSM